MEYKHNNIKSSYKHNNSITPLPAPTSYMVRFDQVIPRASGSICYMTVGVLLKRLAAGLHGISHVILDEVHERDVNTDFLLIVLRRLIDMNSRLRIILMSATMDLQQLQHYFSRRYPARIIDIPGRNYPVTSYFLEDIIELLGYVPPLESRRRYAAKNESIVLNPNMDYSTETVTALAQMNENEFHIDLIEKILVYIVGQDLRGGVLVFLPGWEEIARCLKV